MVSYNIPDSLAPVSSATKIITGLHQQSEVCLVSQMGCPSLRHCVQFAKPFSQRVMHQGPPFFLMPSCR